MRYFTATILALLLCSFSACSLWGNKSAPLEELGSSADKKEMYVVRIGDSLNVKVWGEPRLSGEVYVREDGRVTMPLINDVEAAGKTVPELSKDVANKLREFVPSASVTISVSQSSPIRYFLSGNFQKPGDYRSDARITFLQAIATAGGFQPFADEGSVMLIRVSPTGEQRYELDYNEVVEGNQPNPTLRDGDTIVVK